MATIHDVPRLAGVGIGTVSRVVNHGPHVKMAKSLLNYRHFTHAS